MFDTWEKVAVEYKNIDSVKVVQMNAHDNKKPGISVFPSIKYVITINRNTKHSRLFPAGHDNKNVFPGGITCKGKELNVKNIAAFVAENARYEATSFFLKVLTDTPRRTPQEEVLKRTGPSAEQWAQHKGDDDVTLGQTLILAKEEL